MNIWMPIVLMTHCHFWMRFIFRRCDNCKLCYHFHCLDPPVKVSDILIRADLYFPFVIDKIRNLNE